MVGRGRSEKEEKKRKTAKERLTSIVWTRFGKPTKKGRVEKQKEKEEMVMMEEAKERKRGIG